MNRTHGSRFNAAPIALVSLLGMLLTTFAHASPGPANVAVVVNADSWASMTIANEYVHLRNIPPANVLYLRDLPEFEEMDVEQFREKVLKPVLGTLQMKGLHGQIDCIAWSSDIPFRVNVSADKKDGDFARVITPWASINGLTYLYRQVLAKDAAYLSLGANRYARRPYPVLDSEELPREEADTYQAARELLKKKEWAGAEKALQELAESHPQVPDVLYNLACCLARLDRPDDAMRELQRAVDAGFMQFSQILGDEDFTALRERDDFKKLIEQMKQRPFDIQPTRGFRSPVSWSQEGQPGGLGGASSYMLSTMLAVTSGRGNSLQEAIASLQASASADATHPKGTIYYMTNGDIRTRTRNWGYHRALAMLGDLGLNAQVVEGAIPQGKDDVQGLMAGTPGFRWDGSKSTILPGAICEHLTSLGGIMIENSGQTPLSEFIRYGAAGASGTVTEPYAIQAKFPDPFIHVHYARGCTLAEAFYQSVTGPYQLLIVGDPLCRPWASPPDVTVKGLETNQVVRGRISVEIATSENYEPGVDRYECFIDGMLFAACQPNEALEIDTRQIPEGRHDLLISAVADDMIETRGETSIPFQVRNHGLEITVEPPEKPTIEYGETLCLKVAMPQGAAVSILHNRRAVGRLQGSEGQIQIDTRDLGMGPVTLEVIGTLDPAKPGVAAIAEPVHVRVVAPPPIAAEQIPDETKWTDGLLLTPEGKDGVSIESIRDRKWLEKAGVKPGEQFELTAYINLDSDDMCQIQATTDGEVSLELDSALSEKLPADRWRFIPVSLAAGHHRLTLRGKAGKGSLLDVRFGRNGTYSLAGPTWRHKTEQAN